MAINEPAGAPRPFERQKVTVSKCCAYLAANSRGHDRIEQPGSVEVHGNPVGGGHCADGSDDREWVDRPASGVVGILEADECALNTVGIFGADGGLDLFRRHEALLAGDPMKLDSGQRRGRPLLVADDVGLAFNDHFRPGSVCARRQSWLPRVPDGTKSAARLPTNAAADFLQPIDSRVFSIDIVAHFGARHGFAHGGDGLVTVSLRRSIMG